LLIFKLEKFPRLLYTFSPKELDFTTLPLSSESPPQGQLWLVATLRFLIPPFPVFLLWFFFFCQFNSLQTIVFLQVSMWCKQGIFGRKVLLGEIRVALGSLNLSVKQVSWYQLFIDSQLSE